MSSDGSYVGLSGDVGFRLEEIFAWRFAVVFSELNTYFRVHVTRDDLRLIRDAINAALGDEQGEAL